MSKYLFMVQADCADPAKEKELNDWYENIHVPDMLEATGAVKVTRYLNLSPGTNKRPKYVALYEIETEDIKEFDKLLMKGVKKAEAAGRMSNLLVPESHYPFEPAYYKEISTRKGTKKK
jgi:hypothetical protein